MQTEATNDVVVSTNEAGDAVAVTRQNDEGQILKVLWTRPTTLEPWRATLLKDLAATFDDIDGAHSTDRQRCREAAARIRHYLKQAEAPADKRASSGAPEYQAAYNHFAALIAASTPSEWAVLRMIFAELLGLENPASPWEAIHIKSDNRYQVTGEHVNVSSKPVPPEAVMVTYLDNNRRLACELTEFVDQSALHRELVESNKLETRINATNVAVPPGAILVAYEREGLRFLREAEEFIEKFAAERPDTEPASNAARHGTAALLQQLSAMKAERDDADRRAGAAERQLEYSNRDAQSRDAWLRKAKAEWGVDNNVSFDVVWAEALALKAAATK